MFKKLVKKVAGSERNTQRELEAWARAEYKNDQEFATYMVSTYGTAAIGKGLINNSVLGNK